MIPGRLFSSVLDALQRRLADSLVFLCVQVNNLEFSYRNGNSTLLDYLSALSDYRQVNLAALNANLQLLLSFEQLSYVTHTELVP